MADELMVHGAKWLLGGALVTVGTYLTAMGGGTYVVAWGPMAYGAVQLIRGFFLSLK